MKKTIFITGASRGFGKIWTSAFLKRGDNVAAAVRNPDSMDDLKREFGDSLLVITLDITNRDKCFAAIKITNEVFGRVDTVINNAGYGFFGVIEETSEQQARDQIEVNIFGTLWITQASLPVMRAQGFGHIIQLSSVLGLTTLPVLGMYNASKWAVEGLSESLAKEVDGFGINVTMVEPDGFSTDWSGPSAVWAQSIQAYDPVKAALKARWSGNTVGDPEATAEAILQLVDSSNPPLRLLLGKNALSKVKKVYEERTTIWEAWDEVAIKAHGN